LIWLFGDGVAASEILSGEKGVAARLGSRSKTKAQGNVTNGILKLLIVCGMLAPCFGIERQLNVFLDRLMTEELDAEGEVFEENVFHRMG
jgi:hypothetical protein